MSKQQSAEEGRDENGEWYTLTPPKLKKLQRFGRGICVVCHEPLEISDQIYEATRKTENWPKHRNKEGCTPRD